jgi:hypothetical protein
LSIVKLLLVLIFYISVSLSVILIFNCDDVNEIDRLYILFVSNIMLLINGFVVSRFEYNLLSCI